MVNEQLKSRIDADNLKGDRMFTTILNRQIKALKKHTQLSHAKCQELLARSYRCSDFHELQKLVKSRPDDKRLSGAFLNPSSFPGTADDWVNVLTFQASILAKSLTIPESASLDLAAAIHGFDNWEVIDYQTLDDLISSDPVFYQIDNAVEDLMSDAIASTNASGFMIDDYEILDSYSNDDMTQYVVTLNVTYSGEQHPDKPWSGDQFHPCVDAYFERENGCWVFESLVTNTNIENYTSEDSDIDDWADSFLP